MANKSSGYKWIKVYVKGKPNLAFRFVKSLEAAILDDSTIDEERSRVYQMEQLLLCEPEESPDIGPMTTKYGIALQRPDNMAILKVET